MTRFRFSWKITSVSLLLAAVMIWCADWQWHRYLYKKQLVAAYAANTEAASKPFPSSPPAEGWKSLAEQRMLARGVFDYSRQTIVTNRKDASGPGHWLIAPLRLENSDLHLFVSRGFIPFADLTPDRWKKYTVSHGPVEIEGIVQESAKRAFLGPRNPSAEAGEFQTRFFYPDAAEMARQLPYPVVTEVFLQQLERSQPGDFPAPSVRIEVPPATHLGYTIEWSILALVTLAIGTALQFRGGRRTADGQHGE